MTAAVVAVEHDCSAPTSMAPTQSARQALPLASGPVIGVLATPEHWVHLRTASPVDLTLIRLVRT